MDYYVLSDVHGRIKETKKALTSFITRLQLGDTQCKLIALGDYIGKGASASNSIATLTLFMQLQNAFPHQVIVLRGNWEEYVRLAFTGTNEEKKRYQQLLHTHKQTALLEQLANEKRHDLLTFIADMPLYHMEGDFFFSHTGADLFAFKGMHDIPAFLAAQTIHSLVLQEDFYTTCSYYNMDVFPFYFVAGHIPIQLIQKHQNRPLLAPYLYNGVIGVDFGVHLPNGGIGLVKLTPSMETLFIPTTKKE